MNKSRLTQIILRDLEEIKNLTEEVAQSDLDSSLIISLSISKSKLLTKELELLLDLNKKLVPIIAQPPVITEEESNEQNDIEPEFEILKTNTEQDEFVQQEEEIAEVDEFPEYEADDENIEDEDLTENENIDTIEEESQADLLEIDDDFDIEDEIEEEDEDIEEEEVEEDEVEEDDIEFETVELEENDFDNLNEESISKENNDADESEDLIDETSVNNKETIIEEKVEVASGVREIYIDDEDDEELEPFEIKDKPEAFSKPIMREIPKPEEPLVQEKPIVGERFQKEKSLNDAIGETKANETKFSHGPISNLRSAIGLNDRFLFIREIFDNNTEKYNTIIEQLDKFETIQQAVDYLKVNLTLQKNETSLKFVDLLKRRFGN